MIGLELVKLNFLPTSYGTQASQSLNPKTSGHFSIQSWGK